MIDNVAAWGLRYARDVGSLRILAPVDTVDYGSTVTPRARVANHSAMPLDFAVRFDVPGLYSSSAGISLPADDSTAAQFPSFVADTSGPMSAACSTRLDGDDFQPNDRVETPFFVRKIDVAPIQVLVPYDTTPGALFLPCVRLHNYGTQTALLSLRLFIDRSTDQTVYDTIETAVPLEPGQTSDHLFTTPWRAESAGAYIATAITILAGDMVPQNDLIRKSFSISPLFAKGWHEVSPMPAAPSGRACKDGAWLALGPDSLVFAAKGNKTGDFYAYLPLADTWRELPAMPAGTDSRLPYRGSVGVFDGSATVYATKGNNTAGFWRYSADSASWRQLSPVPLGHSRKRVKGGTDLAYVVRNDTGWVYLLKGLGQDFFRFNAATGVWDTALPLAPAGVSPKWDKGSWLVHDGGNALYAHKAKRHELWRFDLASRTWTTSALPGMPLVGRTGRSKKSKDGGSAAFDSLGGERAAFALKGGNTQEFWHYSCFTGGWTELETMPCFGSTGRRKRVKAGGDVVSYGSGVFFALKGSKTLELWRYVGRTPPAAAAGRGVGRGGVAGGCGRSGLELGSGFVTAGGWVWTRGDRVARLRVFDVAGRLVLNRTLAGGASRVRLELAAGVYLARLDAEGLAVTRKLVVE
jgi:hypothetical protein